MPFKGGRTDGKTVRRTRGGNISPYYFTVNSSAKRSVSIHALAHSRREGGKGEEIRKNERSIDIYFGKGAAGKKAAAACAVIQCVRKREKNGFIAKMALFDGGGQTDRTGIMPGP